MTKMITFYLSINDAEALIFLGTVLGTSPGWLGIWLNEDNENDLVEITLEFASKDAAASFADRHTMYGRVA